MILLGVVLLFALLMRLPNVFSERLWPDEALYAYIAQRFLENPAYIFSPLAYADHLPFFSMILSLGALFEPGLAGFRGVTILINVMGIGLTYALGRRVGGKAVGLLAAIFLATNVFYYQQADMVHNDGLFMVAYLALALVLLRKNSGVWMPVILAAWLASACKWYGIFLVAPVLFGYYLLAFPQVFAVRLKDFLRIMLWVVVPLAPYYIFKIIYIHGEGGIATFHALPWWTYAQGMAALVGGKWHLLLVFLGMICLWRYPWREKVLVYLMAVLLIVIMSLVPEKDNRYLLPMMPFLGVLFAVGMKESIRFVFRSDLFGRALKIMVVAAIALMTALFLARKDQAHLDRVYLGFAEAGAVVQKEDDGKAVILAGSTRQVRYAANIKDVDRVQRIPALQQDLVSMLAKTNAKVILEVDVWDWRQQPGWVYPMTRERLGLLRDLGFQPRTIIRKKINGKWQDVVFVLVRPALSK
jgi:hypothetical protein